MKRIHIALPFLLLALLSCSEEPVLLFDRDEAGVYFSSGSHDSGGREYYEDSLSFSFGRLDIDMTLLYEEYFNYLDYGTPMTPLDDATLHVTEHLVRIPVVTLGKARDYPRPVRVVVDETRTTATRGVHYEVDLDAVVVPAGASSTTLDVRLSRATDLTEREVAVAFKIEENDHFNIYFETRKNTNLYSVAGEPVDATRFVITANELFTEPLYWNYCNGMWGLPPNLGTWSPRKYAFVNATLGWSDADWVTFGFPISKIALGRLGYASTVARDKLQALADAGTPEREADGSLMQLAGAYLVDYSAYE